MVKGVAEKKEKDLYWFFVLFLYLDAALAYLVRYHWW